MPMAQAYMANAGQLPIDSAVDAPYAGFMNLQVPPELEAKLTRLAAETGRTADQVAIDLLASSWITTSGSAARLKRVGLPRVKADCSSTTMS